VENKNDFIKKSNERGRINLQNKFKRSGRSSVESDAIISLDRSNPIYLNQFARLTWTNSIWRKNSYQSYRQP
jgi:hypothetical protein